MDDGFVIKTTIGMIIVLFTTILQSFDLAGYVQDVDRVMALKSPNKIEAQTSSQLMEQTHIMPHPPTMPWNAQAMPWTVAAYSGLMEFTANQHVGFDSMKDLCSKKRKSEIDVNIPEKQFISEEKMAAHLDGLHISSEYISHRLNSPNTSSTTFTVPSDMTNNQHMGTVPECSASVTPKDLEEKLKNANRIIICDEIRQLNVEDSIIPKALLVRYEKPCTALVLWQPPQNLSDKIVPSARKNEEMIEDEEKDNNNSTVNLDLNYCMDVEM